MCLAARTAQLIFLCVALGVGPALSADGGSESICFACKTQRSAPADSLTASGVAFVLRYGTSVRPKSRADRWLGRDKAKHVAFSALWTLSTQYVLVNKVGWRTGRALPASVGSAAAVGVAKEVYDARQRDRTASAKDLAADAVGIGLAATIILL